MESSECWPIRVGEVLRIRSAGPRPGDPYWIRLCRTAEKMQVCSIFEEARVFLVGKRNDTETEKLERGFHLGFSWDMLSKLIFRNGGG